MTREETYNDYLSLADEYYYSSEQQQYLQLYHHHHHRLLEEDNTNTTTSDDDSDDGSGGGSGGDSQVLRDTFAVYGSILIGIFLLFCYVRRKFPKPYTIRRWAEEKHNNKTPPISEDQFGFFSWIWQLNAITEDELLEYCGLDSLCILRVLRMGYKIALVSIFNAIWLMPLYSTAKSDSETAKITDGVVQVTIANLPSGSPRLVGTVIAAYILFGYVMHLILHEFEWFIEMRHKFRKKTRPENYAVYVKNVPSEYRSNAKLLQYFRNCLSESAVTQAHMRIKTPTLAGLVSKREQTVYNLEHAISYKEIKGETPMHNENLVLTAGMGSQKVESIPAYAKELLEANAEITNRIEELEPKLQGYARSDVEAVEIPASPSSWEGRYRDSLLTTDIPEESSTNAEGSSDEDDNNNNNGHRTTTEDPSVHSIASSNVLGQGVSLLGSATKSVAHSAASTTLSAAKTATQLIPNMEEGDFYSAGFVCFSTLGQANAALQMVHHTAPFRMEVQEAPRPSDIFWMNVGRTHKDLEIGKLFSLAATSALCLFWTIPMTFIASLSSVEALSTKVKFIGSMIKKFPWLGPVFEIIAPLGVVVVNALLPIILEFLSMFEGPVSSSVVTASLFIKLAAFMIIQTFFVSAVSSSLLQEIENIIESPTKIVEILAVSLPSQSTYFIQIVFVSCVISTSMEILRVVPLIMAFIRRFLPPKLTEKERERTVFGIRPLADPTEFEAADALSQIVLNFIVMLVYATLAPMTAFIQLFCYLFIHICYKHQFVYIYPLTVNPDSGGRIWTNFIKTLMSCMLIAQFTILGLMGLKQGVIAAPLMFPLIIITVLFNAYVRQQHFRVAEYLPSRECMKVDIKNGPNFDMSFTKDVYIQEELRDKNMYPEDMSEEEVKRLGGESENPVGSNTDPLALP